MLRSGAYSMEFGSFRSIMSEKQDTAILGICGGIAAYKAVTVTSKLRQAGLDVHVLMTEAATKFVTPLTFEAVSRNKVVVSSLDPRQTFEVLTGEKHFDDTFMKHIRRYK